MTCQIQKSSRYRSIAFALFSLLSANLHAQDYTVDVKTVSVWIKAVDGEGKPVTKLMQEDFAVFENGTPASVTCFEEANLFAKQDPTTGLPTLPQKFVLFLDLYNTTPPEYLRLKPQLQEFIQSLSNKNHDVMLAALMPTRKMGVIAPFTKDLNRIRLLLNKASANPMRDVNTERRFDEIIRVFEGATGDTLSDIVIQVAHDVEFIANQEKEESEFSLDALESFAVYLEEQQINERIVMLMVSGGFAREPGRRYYDIIDRLALRALNNDPLKFTGFKTANFDFDSQLQKSVGRLAKQNVIIYTLDTRGAARRKEYQDSLIEIARATGGISFYNSLNFKQGLSDVVQDLGHQYVLCYSAPEHTKKGTFHKIKINCKKEDVNLRYRTGYLD